MANISATVTAFLELSVALSIKATQTSSITNTLKKNLLKYRCSWSQRYWHEHNLSVFEKNLMRWRQAGAAFYKGRELQAERINMATGEGSDTRPGVSDPGDGRYRSFE